MAHEELFTDLLKAEREEDVTDALTVFGLEQFSDSNWLPYGGIENKGMTPARVYAPLVRVFASSIPTRSRRSLAPRSTRSLHFADHRFAMICSGRDDRVLGDLNIPT
jgi:hypothetical protein